MIDDKTLAIIADMTSSNYHVNALIVGSKMLGYAKLVEQFELVQRLQELEGYLPDPLGQYRFMLYTNMMGQAKRDLSEEDFKRFHDAY